LGSTGYVLRLYAEGDGALDVDCVNWAVVGVLRAAEL
jgi:hypothetical protein